VENNLWKKKNRQQPEFIQASGGFKAVAI